MKTRRDFIKMSAVAGTALAGTTVATSSLARLPDPVIQTSPDTVSPIKTDENSNYNPVVTLNGWTLPYRMNGEFKEFHLVAEPVVRELGPGMTANLWGYNGQSPGPTIEVVEGDKIRIYLTNKLPEHTSIHWHGQRLPNGMDGVAGLNQAAVNPGKTFVYEFQAKRPGTFMYHPHADEMTQMAMGMMGFWVTHPKHEHPWISTVERDYCILLNAFDIVPGAETPNIMTMLDFNLWAWNSRIFPGIAPLVARKNDRVRVRVGNLTMTNHPIHVHGIEFEVTGTDGGPTRPESRWKEVTTDIAVGQMRQIEFVADEEGDWAMHCHKSHHSMNAMGHDVPTMIGVDHRGITERIRKLVPDYMVMGERGMADMTEMTMPLPDNTLPMMTGDGPYGSVEMGGMFSMLKVRSDLAPDDYSDPGWYKHPEGHQAYEYSGELPEVSERFTPGNSLMAPKSELASANFKAVKPNHRKS